MASERDPVPVGSGGRLRLLGAAEALRRERDLLSAVLDTAGALVAVLDRQGCIVRFNRACETTTGYTLEEVRGKTLWDLFLLPEETEPVRSVFERLRAGQFPSEHENYWLTKTGDRRLIAWTNTALLDSHGAVEYVIGTGIDITQRRQAESQRDATFQELLRARDELERRVAERTARLGRANEILEEEVAERRRAEEALRESESHMRSLMDSARNYGVYRVAFDPARSYLGRVILASPSLTELLSIPDLYDFSSWFGRIHPDDLARIVEANRRSLETGVPFDEQFRIFKASRGEWDWVHVRSTPVFEPDGGATHFNGLVVDITEQKRAEQALRESEEKFRGIVEYANIGIAIVQEARFRFVNPHFAAMLGYTVQELLDQEFMTYCAPEERERIVDFYTRRARGEMAPARYETAMVHGNGAYVYAEVSAGMIPYGGQRATFVFLHDITEERRAKRALEEAYQTLEQRVQERTRELAVLNSIAGVVSGSLDLREIMSAALNQTCEALGMEFGTAYGLVGGTRRPPDGRVRGADAAGPATTGAAAQAMQPTQGRSDQTAEFEPLVLLAYHGLSGEYVESIGEFRLPGELDALIHLGQPFVWLAAEAVVADSDVQEVLEREECLQVVTLPLVAKGHLVGAINLGARTPREFTPEQLSLLAAIGQQIGVALDNARLYEAEQRRREEAERRRRVAEGLREILATLNSDLPLSETLDEIAAQAPHLLGSDATALCRLDRQTGIVTIQASHGLEAEFVENLAFEVGRVSVIGEAILTLKPAMTLDLAARVSQTEVPPEWSPLRELAARMATTYRTVLAVPVLLKSETYGALALYYRTQRQFTQEEVDLAVAFADQAALAIENARLREQAEQAAAMEERGRLARELHDSVTQSLYSVTMYAEAAARLMPPGGEAAAQHLRDARDTAQEALREMRLLIYQLRPPALARGGLAVALQVRLDAVERRGGIQAELTVEGEDRLPPAIQAELHQIAQEALNNALKHAHARQVQVRLRFGPGETRLEVRDEGVGFDPVVAQAGGGLGLANMRERVARIGGQLRIESAPGRGTKIMIRVPTGGEG
ncbi:MAG: PAS domain S-box protein [Anaerolineae bacterium]|nr:PAS domain S-box protein [Anaerolineae bacterium]